MHQRHTNWHGWPCALTIIVAVSAIPNASSAANLLINGGFETYTADPASWTDPFVWDNVLPTSTDLDGWEVLATDVDFLTPDFWQPSQGQASLDLSGFDAGGVRQSFDTEAGQSFTVSFDMAGDVLGGNSTKEMTVQVTNTTDANELFTDTYTFDTTGLITSNMGWTTHQFQFIASGNNSTISFTSLDANAFGPALDNVVITPEPAAVFLLLAAAGLTTTRRARPLQRRAT